MRVVISSLLFFMLGVNLIAQNVSTAEDRAALFDYIYQKTLEREAFSPVKEKVLGVNVKAAMQACRAEVVNAKTDQELYFALQKLSAARKDRHLRVRQVEDGLRLSSLDSKTAPIQFLPDYGNPDNYFLFVSNLTEQTASFVTGKQQISLGDKLLAVNGMPFPEYFERAEPYLRYSSKNNLWRRMAHELPNLDNDYLPASFYKEKLELQLEDKAGNRYFVSLPYLEEEDLEWKHDHARNYPDFELAFKKQSFHLYLPKDPSKKVLLLWWYGFRENLIEDMDYLVEYAGEKNLLDWDIIIDATGSRGGSRGAYVLQKLVSKPFKTTFGNLKLSDITLDFVHEMNERYVERNINDNGVPESVIDGAWVIDWLNNDVVQGLASGQEYSNNVPFKNAHLPKYSDGYLRPAEKHFTGRLVCLFGPWGGSHLDQFSAMVHDNDLGHSIGMPSGGYSNTWEWEETLRFPISGKPVMEFMWSIGHTIRPDGEILEGNPAQVDEYFPLTRDNFTDYLPHLLEKSFKWLQRTKGQNAKP